MIQSESLRLKARGSEATRISLSATTNAMPAPMPEPMEVEMEYEERELREQAWREQMDEMLPAGQQWYPHAAQAVAQMLFDDDDVAIFEVFAGGLGTE